MSLKRRKYKKIFQQFLIVLYSLLITLFILEVFLGIFAAVKNNRFVKPYLAFEETGINSWINKAKKENGCGFENQILPDPYLGWVWNPETDCLNDHLEGNLNNFSINGPDFPYKKDPEKYYILITGGSVANNLATYDYIKDGFGPYFKGKEIVILNGSFGAWSLPQQLNLFIMFAESVDMVIELDGFNELIKFTKTNSYFEIPAEFFLFNLSSASSLQFHLYKDFFLFFSFIYNKSTLCNFSFSCKWFSVFFSQLIKKKLNEKLFKESVVQNTIKRYSYPVETDLNLIYSHKIEKYKYYIRLMDLIAKWKGIPFFHFLQPVPALFKKLTEEEIKVTQPEGVPPTIYNPMYKELVKELGNLSEEGINSFSLLKVFENYRGTIYTDYIHFNNEGNRLVSETIVSEIKLRLKLGQK